MRSNWVYRTYVKELINYLNLIILIILINYLIQVDRQSESAILWINLTLRARNKRLRKKPVAAENLIAPWSPSSIGSKIPVSKTWQGSLCTTLARYDKIFNKIPSQKSKNSFPNQNSFSKTKNKNL